MKTLPSRLAVSLVAACIALPAFAQNVATVNGTAIPQSHADLLINEQKAQGAPDSDQLRNAVKEHLINLEVLTQAAQKKGLDKTPAVQTRLQLARESLLTNAYIQDYIKAHPVSDADVKAEYEKAKAQMGDKEWLVFGGLGVVAAVVAVASAGGGNRSAPQQSVTASIPTTT